MYQEFNWNDKIGVITDWMDTGTIVHGRHTTAARISSAVTPDVDSGAKQTVWKINARFRRIQSTPYN